MRSFGIPKSEISMTNLATKGLKDPVFQDSAILTIFFRVLAEFLKNFLDSAVDVVQEAEPKGVLIFATI